MSALVFGAFPANANHAVPVTYGLEDSRCDNHSCSKVWIDAELDPANALDTTPAVAAASRTLYWGSNGVCIANVAVSGCASGGDIIGVFAGTGLTGGATFGNATLSIADGGVGTTQLAANAVISAKIADGTIALADLAFDPATQAELDGHKTAADHDSRYFTESELQSVGTINAVGNPVDWTKLKGVPTGFADGSDANSGGTVTSVTAGTGLSGGSITGAGTIALSINGGAAQSCSGTQKVSSVSSTGIVTCTADADAGGDITAVNAGGGLTGGGTTGAVTLSADTSVVQSRVSSSCAAGSAIRVVNSDGTVTCEADDVGASGFTVVAGYINYQSDGTNYVLPVGYQSGHFTSESSAQIPTTRNVDVQRLRVHVISNSLQAGETASITVRKNAADTSLSLSYSSGETGSKSSNAVFSANDGDLISLKVAISGASTSRTLVFKWAFEEV